MVGDLGCCISGIAGISDEKVVLDANVMLGGVAESSDFIRGEGTDLLGGATQIEIAAFETLATCDKAAGSNHHVVLNDNIIENY